MKLRIMKQTSADAFPALEILAAAPAEIGADDEVRAPEAPADREACAYFAARLQALVADGEHAWWVCAVTPGPWTHCLRLRLNDGEYDADAGDAFRDFVVVARGLPADAAEAAAHGFKLVELEPVDLTPPAPGRCDD